MDNTSEHSICSVKSLRSQINFALTYRPQKLEPGSPSKQNIFFIQWDDWKIEARLPQSNHMTRLSHFHEPCSSLPSSNMRAVQFASLPFRVQIRELSSKEKRQLISSKKSFFRTLWLPRRESYPSTMSSDKGSHTCHDTSCISNIWRAERVSLTCFSLF